MGPLLEAYAPMPGASLRKLLFPQIQALNV